MKINLIAIYYILGNTGKRNRQLIKIDGVVITDSKLTEQVGKILPSYQSTENFGFYPFTERNRKHILL